MTKKHHIILCCLFIPTIASVAKELSCYADYLGNIMFKFKPINHQCLQNQCNKFYYTRNLILSTAKWTEEKDCRYHAEDELICNMHQLTNDRKFGFADENNYQFMLSVTSNQTTKNFTDFRFNNRNNSGSPWSTLLNFYLCAHTTGVKYFAVIGSFHNITVDIIHYALNVKYGDTLSDIRLRFTGPGIDQTNIIEKEKHCDKHKHDFCTYTQQSLEPCSNFRVCMQVYYKHILIQSQCKSVFTLGCNNSNKPSIQWPYKLFLVFCIFISMLLIIVTVFVFNRIRKGIICKTYNGEHIEPRMQVINQEELRNQHIILKYKSEEHIYQYPVLLPSE